MLLLLFTYLKLIDQALRYSKEDILKASQDSGKDLFEVAVYPSGETLGFYNTCSFDLSDISLIISDIETCDKLLSYIGGFSDNVKDVFKEIDFKGLIDFLVEYNLLSRFTSMVYIEELGNDNFIDYNSFVGLFEKFIYYMAHDEYYNMGLAEISNLCLSVFQTSASLQLLIGLSVTQKQKLRINRGLQEKISGLLLEMICKY